MPPTPLVPSVPLTGRDARAQAVAHARSQAPRLTLGQVPKGPTIRLPIAWFFLPFWKGIMTVVRPPVASMRRSLHKLTFPFPRECFETFLKCVPDGKAGLRRSGGRVQPTGKGSGVNFYQFTFGSPSLVTEMISFQTREIAPRGKAGRGRWRRGVGGARLALSMADGQRGMLAKLIAMIAGTLTVRYREPTNYSEMPRMSLSFFVLTIDSAGHIEWPTRFNLDARAKLRKLARREIQIMLDDQGAYPIDPSFSAALTQMGESYLDLVQVRAAAAARKAALIAERNRLRALRRQQQPAQPAPQ